MGEEDMSDNKVPDDVMKKVRARTGKKEGDQEEQHINGPEEKAVMSPVVDHYQKKLDALQEKAASLTEEFEMVERQANWAALYEKCKGQHEFEFHEALDYDKDTMIPSLITLKCKNCDLESQFITTEDDWWTHEGEKYPSGFILNEEVKR